MLSSSLFRKHMLYSICTRRGGPLQAYPSRRWWIISVISISILRHRCSHSWTLNWTKGTASCSQHSKQCNTSAGIPRLIPRPTAKPTNIWDHLPEQENVGRTTAESVSRLNHHLQIFWKARTSETKLLLAVLRSPYPL